MRRNLLVIILPVLGALTLTGVGYSAWVFASNRTKSLRDTIKASITITDLSDAMYFDFSNTIKNMELVLDQGEINSANVNEGISISNPQTLTDDMLSFKLIEPQDKEGKSLQLSFNVYLAMENNGQQEEDTDSYIVFTKSDSTSIKSNSNIILTNSNLTNQEYLNYTYTAGNNSQAGTYNCYIDLTDDNNQIFKYANNKKPMNMNDHQQMIEHYQKVLNLVLEVKAELI